MMSPMRAGLVLTLVAGMSLSACTRASSSGSADIPPVRVERVSGSEYGRVILSTRAAERLGIMTEPVRAMPVAGTQAAETIPYAALLYGSGGETWTYTNPSPLTFVRSRVTVEHIDGAVAVLSDGPAPGMAVVTVGAAELLGAENGVGQG
jgi:hypothetical protein